MASRAFPLQRHALGLGWRETKARHRRRTTRRPAGPASRDSSAGVARASVSLPKSLGGMRRRDDGTWDGASPPRCRFAPPTPETSSRRATVTEASRTESPSAETRAETEPPEPAPDPFVADLSWTPSGFIPDHENNIVTHLFPSRPKKKAETRGVQGAEPDADVAEARVFVASEKRGGAARGLLAIDRLSLDIGHQRDVLIGPKRSNRQKQDEEYAQYHHKRIRLSPVISVG